MWKPPIPGIGKVLMKTYLDVAKPKNASESLDQKQNNGTVLIDTLKPSKDSGRSAYDTGYRQGYMEGFADGCKLSNPADRATTIVQMPSNASKTTVNKRENRLRGLPCSNCGCASFSDEAHCPGCGTPKTLTAAENTQK
jgi:hypothetical protein